MARFCIWGLAITTVLFFTFLQGMHNGYFSREAQFAAEISLQENLHKAVSNCDLPEIERLWEAGAGKIKIEYVRGCTPEDLLCNASCNSKPKSVPVVAFFISKGANINHVISNVHWSKSLFEMLLEAHPFRRHFETKKEKVLMLMDAGVKINFKTMRELVAKKIQEVERDGACEWEMGPEQWRELEQIIDGPRWRAELPAILQEFVPVQLALLIGPYAHPYYDAQDSLEQESADGFSASQLQATAGREPQLKKLKLEHEQDVESSAQEMEDDE